MKYSHVIWDWNGTILDDVNWCVEVTNRMMEKRGMAPFDGVWEYRNVFGFPVKDYYKKIGFDFEREPFPDLAEEFMDAYLSGEPSHCKLHGEVLSVIDSLRRAGVRQVILSASERDKLEGQVRARGIYDHFDAVLGTGDIYAGGKVEIGHKFMEDNLVRKALLVGDTVHDCEVATAIGADCVLISKGHQGKEQLLRCGVLVLDNVSKLTDFALPE